jgi:predicted RNA polymerase sigma factor
MLLAAPLAPKPLLCSGPRRLSLYDLAMRDGPAAGLAPIQDLNKEGELAGYQWLYSA